MYQYLTIDGYYKTTGIRTTYGGEYIEPAEIGIDEQLIQRIKTWVESYTQALLDDNKIVFETLDIEGIQIAQLVKKQFPEKKIKYYSAGMCKEVLI